MSDSPVDTTPPAERELEFDQQTLTRIRERVLTAEKNKLHLDLPRGINNEIEEIIREEIN